MASTEPLVYYFSDRVGARGEGWYIFDGGPQVVTAVAEAAFQEQLRWAYRVEATAEAEFAENLAHVFVLDDTFAVTAVCVANQVVRELAGAGLLDDLSKITFGITALADAGFDDALVSRISAVHAYGELEADDSLIYSVARVPIPFRKEEGPATSWAKS